MNYYQTVVGFKIVFDKALYPAYPTPAAAVAAPIVIDVILYFWTNAYSCSNRLIYSFASKAC